MPYKQQAIEQEEDDLREQLDNGQISLTEYDDRMREMRRSLEAEYERDCFEAQAAVNREWG